MKIAIFDLEFDVECCYIQRDSIVEKISFNNRTLYSKFEKIDAPPSDILINQHLHKELVLALPLITNNLVNYLVLEYEKEESERYYHLIKHLLKSLDIDIFYTYESSQENHIQIFIPRENLTLDNAYIQVEKIKHLLELKSSKRCKIFPNKNLPENYNKITLPTKKM
ncbi:MAG: DUF1882 domain-containing protein [Epsilonproteobacteria bacterium]|nr:DUF1882 domain-containing protein [Campylobacterota bacterium]